MTTSSNWLCPSGNSGVAAGQNVRADASTSRGRQNVLGRTVQMCGMPRRWHVTTQRAEPRDVERLMDSVWCRSPLPRFRPVPDSFTRSRSDRSAASRLGRRRGCCPGGRWSDAEELSQWGVVLTADHPFIEAAVAGGADRFRDAHDRVRVARHDGGVKLPPTPVPTRERRRRRPRRASAWSQPLSPTGDQPRGP